MHGESERPTIPKQDMIEKIKELTNRRHLVSTRHCHYLLLYNDILLLMNNLKKCVTIGDKEGAVKANEIKFIWT